MFVVNQLLARKLKSVSLMDSTKAESVNVRS
jgi:hypothetical protein